MNWKYEWFASLTPNGLVLDNDRVSHITRTNPNSVVSIAEDAKKGDPTAQFLIGYIFDGGGYYGPAVDNYNKAANQGYAPAMDYLARCLFTGDGVEQNELESKKWMSLAFDHGDLGAALWLGTHYDEDSHPSEQFEEPNSLLAAYWYAKGAMAGNANCQNNYAWCLQTGTGVEADEELAVYWYNQSALNGSEIANRFLEREPRARMNISQISAFAKKRWPNTIVEFGTGVGQKRKRYPIEWVVVEDDGNFQTLLCLHALLNFSGSFFIEDRPIWKDSLVRKQLNGEVLSACFSEKERMRLVPIAVKFEPNPIYYDADEDFEFSSESTPCKDFIVVPSLFDLVRWNIKSYAVCYPHPNNPQLIVDSNHAQYPLDWYTRTPGEPGMDHTVYFGAGDFGVSIPVGTTGLNVSYIDANGKPCYNGSTGMCAIRPMIRIKK